MTAGRSKKKCGFCTEQVAYIDYKNIRLLRRFMSQYGRIVPRYYSGICLKHQKRLANAIKLAREMALLPYVR
ncbi:30S ribosomal protein S18 [Candidatus Peregrinibacteria bacterium]|nr:30S ribosomal protein S18 [Candidatus Peregrinibacteria bacterium]